MKKIHMLLPLLAILLSCWSIPTTAQNANDDNRVIIIKKSTDDNGLEIIEKKIQVGSDIEVFTWSNKNGEEMSFDLEDEGENRTIHISTKGDNGEESFSWNGNTENLAELKEQLKALDFRMNNENGNLFLNFSKDNVFNSCSDGTGKPFLGIVMEESVENENGVETIEGANEQGVFIQKVIKGTAAEAAGLKAGDIITAIDGQSTKRVANISTAIKAKKIGDAISISYIRDGSPMQATATLKGKTPEKRIRTRSHRNYDVRTDRRSSFKVDPCKVFIGVYTGIGHDADGLRVNGVIENTPAFDAGLIKGDRILALDGIEINSHTDLLAERNKHNQGDEFTITYIRNGQTNTVDATFKSCKEEKTEVEVLEEVEENNATERQTNNLLDINLKAFPNPTSSAVNVRFVGERTATVVTVTDIKGKEIYREELKNFDGLYNKKINLTKAATGTVIITVQQGTKISSEKILYTPDRA